ncbi:tryptophan halogenase family protein [Novosphingobium jiangmenense]|uniref:Tryptophan 7-halogenase n=1 Tax=Novosphingobium jiangmenense TaxID=2791981 RepID=A0ABS0HKU7_9SPHN|nr:tryptophan halogenase family protein [Novosphingobium jiangmenense]MBF9152873.1 tryptophan 7-halogenase [Novosphingobium jiangmenense]
MIGSVEQVVIVGGGTAGWLSACLLAARRPELAITLVEAPNIPTIGVGEGTWPTMRETLATIGIPEAEFLSECDASFKQGSRFDGWGDGGEADSYYHPFTPPPPGDMAAMLAAWQADAPGAPFAAAMTPQALACDESLAPRQRAMPDYAGALNYGYHLDAGKFATLLKRHATARLGVTHVSAQVTSVANDDTGNISSLRLHDGRELAGDFFIDCSGLAAILIGGHCSVPWVDRSDVSFNDSALALQVPVEAGSAIASQTIGTAHEAGWIWDIALPTRRGIGCVFSSRFMDDARAEEVLRSYVAAKLPGTDLSALRPRKLTFSTGHRERFWHGNCLAVGLSAGFIEPLEASAIVTIELSIKALAESFPRRAATMGLLAERFNELFRYRWDRIVEFLKLHYVLSRRTEPYWLAQRDPATIPARLVEALELWRDQPPSVWDFPRMDELFCAASQQYVLYGMGFPVPAGAPDAAASQRLAEVRQRSRALAAALPSNRTYLDALRPVAAADPIAMHGAAMK